MRLLMLVCLLCACSTTAPPKATPLPTPPPVRDMADVDVWAPRDLSDLEAIARNGTPRDIVTRRPGGPSTCQSVSVGFVEPDEAPEQIAADLTRAMLGEPQAQCNGGNVWAFTDQSQTTMRGSIKLDNDHGRRTARLAIGPDVRWTVTY